MSRLTLVEEEQKVRILYACESGSRAWGFSSKDSDYDVRFVYIHPPDWYLAIDRQRDVIELPIAEGLDLSGWDVRKALCLFKKSNPPLLEWLNSPTIYCEFSRFAKHLKDLLPQYYSPRRSFHHYLRMAQGNYRDYLRGNHVWVKKYFYVLRPLLACRWIERGLGVVPMEFDKIVATVVDEESVKEAIKDLLQQKQLGLELDHGPKVPMISDFIENEINRLVLITKGDEAPLPDDSPLNNVFRCTLKEVWGKSNYSQLL